MLGIEVVVVWIRRVKIVGRLEMFVVEALVKLESGIQVG